MRRIAIFLAVAFLPILVLAAGRLVLTRDAAAQSGTTVSGILTKQWSRQRSSPLDLELGVDLKGLPPGSTRYVTRAQLLALPRVAFTAKNDEMFAGPTQVSGVPFEELIRALGSEPGANLVIAIANDGYRSNYPSDYIRAHRPVLVLEINGKAPPNWPKDAEHGNDLGPYTVAYDNFVPSFKIYAHADEEQIPWGVVRLEFRDEKAVYGAIAPHGSHSSDADVQAGYSIAKQNCFRCHNAGREGGQKSGVTWTVLSALAAGSPEFFMDYVRNPKSRSPQAQMPGSPQYDDETLLALARYFQSSAPAGKP